MASINQNRIPSSVPEFCNLGVILRILLPVVTASAVAALLRVSEPAAAWGEFVAIAAVAQPPLLLSLAALCLLCPLLRRLTFAGGVSIVFAVVILFTAMGYVAIERVYPSIHTVTLWQHVLLAVLGTALLLFYLDLRARALSPALAEARLQALQARIRPHFLFNSITAVLSLIREEPKRAEEALEDMADLFRVLMADNRELTPLSDEIELCRRYLALEQLRLGDRLRVHWHTEKMPADALVPPLVLQPLLENAVYHGIEPVKGTGEISINIYRNRSRLIAVLRNPYLAQGGSHHSGNKMALANIRERLALHFDVEARLETRVLGDTYQVTIIIPYTARPK